MCIDDIYLNKPKTKLTTESGVGDNFKYACASM